VDAATYEGWKQYSLQCARCHGDEARGSSFAPSLVQALTPDGSIGTEARFRLVVADGRPDKGMPAAAKLGIDSLFFSPLYRYLKGRSDGILHPGRPARRDR
jgi:mono/diheme cytochrome c family protein